MIINTEKDKELLQEENTYLAIYRGFCRDDIDDAKKRLHSHIVNDGGEDAALESVHALNCRLVLAVLHRGASEADLISKVPKAEKILAELHKKGLLPQADDKEKNE